MLVRENRRGPGLPRAAPAPRTGLAALELTFGFHPQVPIGAGVASFGRVASAGLERITAGPRSTTGRRR